MLLVLAILRVLCELKRKFNRRKMKMLRMTIFILKYLTFLLTIIYQIDIIYIYQFDILINPKIIYKS